MSFPFPSDAWIKALMEVLNNSEAYAGAAKNWEGDFHFVVEPGGGLTQTMVLYMDLWHGRCRAAHAVAEAEPKPAAFRLTAPYTAWKKVLLRELDPIQGMMTGKLKLKGNIAAIMKSVQAAKELVNCCTLVPTEFLD